MCIGRPNPCLEGCSPVDPCGVLTPGAGRSQIRPERGLYRDEPKLSGPADETHPMQPSRRKSTSKRRKGDGRSSASPSVGSVAKIVQLTSDPDCSMDALAEVVSIDPVLGLRILSLANSSAFALSRRMSDVRQAVALLGIRSIRNLALGLLVSDLAPQTADGERLLEQSVRRGTACRLVGEHLGVKQLDEFFTAGLLLDVGLMTLARTDAKLAADLSSMASPSRSVRERVLGLAPHAELSAKMALECHLPDATVAAIESHHHDEPGESALERATWLAERVAALFDSALVERDRALLVGAADKIGLDTEAIDDILERTPVEVQETAEAFQRQLPPQQTIDEIKANAYHQLIELNAEYEVIVKDLERALAEKSALEAQLRVANDLLSGLANTDELTGLPNRRALQGSVDYQLTISERSQRPLSLVMVDVDHFKNFNDTMGHAAGDAVLRVLGALLRELVRGDDLPARYGGEEFTLLLPDTDEAGALIVAERVRAQLEATLVTEDVPKPCKVTASFGIATTRGGETSESLFGRADQALYVAKEEGRNRVSVAPGSTKLRIQAA